MLGQKGCWAIECDAEANCLPHNRVAQTSVQFLGNLLEGLTLPREGISRVFWKTKQLQIVIGLGSERSQVLC